AERLLRLLAVVEMDRLAPDDLIILVALAGDEHDVPRLRLRDRERNRLGSVQRYLIILTLRRLDAGLDLVGDGGGILAAGIVARDDHVVAEFAGGSAHRTALGAVAVAAAAEYGQDAPVGQLPERREDVDERAVGVCVIDEYMEHFSGADGLEPS